MNKFNIVLPIHGETSEVQRVQFTLSKDQLNELERLTGELDRMRGIYSVETAGIDIHWDSPVALKDGAVVNPDIQFRNCTLHLLMGDSLYWTLYEQNGTEVLTSAEVFLYWLFEISPGSTAEVKGNPINP